MLDDRLHSFWPLPDNYELASKRLSGLYKRFRQTPAVLQEYDRIIQEQLKGGIVHIVESWDHGAQKLHYLPHHPVVRQDKETIKVMIAYDVSAKSSGPSFNNCMYPGPTEDTWYFVAVSNVQNSPHCQYCETIPDDFYRWTWEGCAEIPLVWWCLPWGAHYNRIALRSCYFWSVYQSISLKFNSQAPFGTFLNHSHWNSVVYFAVYLRGWCSLLGREWRECLQTVSWV